MKRLLFFIGLALVPLISFSQQESYYSLYRYNMNVINPAYAGALGKNVFTFTSRRQWSSMQDAPSTLAFSYSSERENNVGLGLSVVSDKVFIEQQTFAYVDFSYKLDMESTQLYLGLKAGGNFYNADPRGLTTYTSSDPAQQQLSRFNPNVGAGAFLKGELFWVSFSIPRLFNVKRENDNLAVTAKDRVHSYLGGGVDLPIGGGLLVKPSVMLRKVKGIPVTTDFTGMLSWQNQFDIGISYRSSSSFAILSVISLGGFDIGYAYETPTVSSLSQLNLKTHEIVLRINLGQGDETTKTGPESQE
ncbi:type IX secretion system membrane protein PorP/SprF [Flavobacteriaceae bacterium]|nr:type IX secretion system membrane protein PorP/SprF [Flavobacteriaceae bacterium]MDA9157737.1 type IX secretion system membrane protein PorP/SprF [Flavobacteriaceae bacterium]MDA9225989.1 type IX secretion system membrane protein PorP/SprF [Flavobacteriaceae bacterium]MDA9833082.1 type IX secretion system membrane protein PorP/SprF [Flavobacteriaceae bacterium]MDB4159650.1 type IX secretion system membrane protein PorP/SprF [Flavobacteriaceae bacterium]